MNNQVPWVDKYRPKKLKHIIHQSHVISVLNQTLITGDLPHLLLYGPAGTGKCLGINTPVVMYNGKIKLVQDIVPGELIMGDDHTPRRVLSTTNGRDRMAIIHQSHADDYRVNTEHILCLMLVDPIVIENTTVYWSVDHQLESIDFSTQEEVHQFTKTLVCDPKYSVCEISVKNYLKKKELWKSRYRGYTYLGELSEISIELDCYDSYYGFELDGNGRFLLGDGTVTHNTSTILSLAHELFGSKVKERILELNASDERGIAVVRNKIMHFAKTSIGNPDEKATCPPYKLVILDEADAMTIEAQSALKKIIESTSHITRFCFICNYIDRIIEPIVSRCVKFRFKPIDTPTLTNTLTTIAKKENMKVDQSVIEYIANIVRGDCRHGIMVLQNAAYRTQHETITVNTIDQITNTVNKQVALPLWKMCMNKNNMSEIIEYANTLRLEGLSILPLLQQLCDIMIESELSDNQKSQIAIEWSIIEKRITERSNEFIQLIAALSYAVSVI